MVRDRSSRALAIGVTLVTVLAAAVAAVVLVTSGGDPAPATKPRTITAVAGTDLRRQTVVRTSGPGYAAWTGAWIGADGSLVVSYTTATGPLDRAKAPASVLDAFGLDRADVAPGRDFWNLQLSVRTVQSTDDGRTWSPVREDPFKSIAPHAYSQQATIGLPDGTVIRRVNGDDLRQDPDVPHTAFLQRLDPGADDWGPPQTLLDPAEATYQITRIRRLTDGRLVASGNVWDVPATTTQAERKAEDVPSRFVLFVSGDDGRTWKEALTIPQSVGDVPGNEWDTAELGDGDLLAVMRTADDEGTPVVEQALLRQTGDGWTMTAPKRLPWKVTGHPELLRTQEGAVLSFGTDGVRWTQDGAKWTPVTFAEPYVSHYYPRAVQTDDGTVHVFSHLGADDPYEAGSHGILDDAFRLQVTTRDGD